MSVARLPWWWRGLALALLTFALAFGLRMVEWPAWQNPEYRLGSEWLLATHDAYHWVAGSEGFGLAAGHPMATMLHRLGVMLHASPAAVAFWFPPVLASLVAVIVFAWVWALGSMEAGLAAGLLTSLAPGFLARTLLGFYDTDLVTLFFPLFITLAPACWVMRHVLLPGMILRRLAQGTGLAVAQRLFSGQGAARALGQGQSPLGWQWLTVLAVSGLLAWWTQEWHSVFPYLIRYNVLLLGGMALVMAPRGQRRLLLLGGLAYALPTLAGPVGLLAVPLLVVAGSRMGRALRHWLCRPQVLALMWLVVAALVIRGDILTTIINHANAYLKHSGDVKTAASGVSLVYPSVAQSIVEVQDLGFLAIFPYFHPWAEAAMLGLLGFVPVLLRRPGAMFLLPLAVLALLGTKLGGRMVMFGAPVVAVGLCLPLFWIIRRFLRADLGGHVAGWATSALVLALLVAPFADMVSAMSQGPMINRRHAEALTRAGSITPDDAMLWLWWDWGYAAHHFARRRTIADGAQHSGPSLYLPAAVFATDNPRFARQLIRHTASKGNEAGKAFEGMDGQAVQELLRRLRSTDTPLVDGPGRMYVVVSFEMLRLGFWISNFGNWDFATRRGGGGALSIVPQELAYRLDTGEVRLAGNTNSIGAASITIFDETGLTRRNYVQEWFDNHPDASPEEQQAFLAGRRNVNFLFNRVTGEKLAVDETINRSLMVRLLVANPQDPHISPYFRLVYDNVFTRIYEVL